MVEASIEQLKQEMMRFLKQDDVPRHLLERLADLRSTKASAGDRLGQVLKDLAVVGRLFKGHDKRQRKKKQPGLTKGSQYF